MTKTAHYGLPPLIGGEDDLLVVFILKVLELLHRLPDILLAYRRHLGVLIIGVSLWQLHLIQKLAQLSFPPEPTEITRLIRLNCLYFSQPP
jgi:hypothetical protein